MRATSGTEGDTGQCAGRTGARSAQAIPPRAGHRSARHGAAAVSGAARCRRRCSGTTTCRSTPTAPRGACRHSSGKGNRYVPSLGIGAAILAGGFRPEEVVLESEAIVFRDRRMPLVATPRQRPGRSAAAARSADDADQLPGAISRSAVSARLRQLRSAPPAGVGRAAAERPEAAGRSRGVQGQDRIRRSRCVRAGRRLHDAVRRRQRQHARDPAARHDGGQPAVEQVHPAGVARAAGSRTVDRRWPARRSAGTHCCRSRPRRSATLLAVAGWTWFSLASFKGGVWLNMAQPLLAMGARAVRGHGLSVLRRRAREASRQEAVRPIRLARRLPPADREPRAGGAWRPAPGDDRAVFRHSRIHQR